jgi:hypothetical protein
MVEDKHNKEYDNVLEDAIDKYAGENEWRGNYIRAEWAGKVLESRVFKKIVEAIKGYESAANNEDKKKFEDLFKQICLENMPDVPEGARKGLIRDMWAATIASRALGDQNKSCW